jgi:hypothetical protein
MGRAGRSSLTGCELKVHLDTPLIEQFRMSVGTPHLFDH